MRELKKYPRGKVFVMGFSGSGKTTFAKEYSAQTGTGYINFDLKYGKEEGGFEDKAVGTKNFLQHLPSTFIVDNVPFENSRFLGYLTKFQHLPDKERIQVVCTFCSDDSTSTERIFGKVEKGEYKFPGGLKLLYDQLVGTSNYMPLWERVGVSIDYYDSFINDYGVREEFLKRLGELKKYE